MMTAGQLEALISSYDFLGIFEKKNLVWRDRDFFGDACFRVLKLNSTLLKPKIS